VNAVLRRGAEPTPAEEPALAIGRLTLDRPRHLVQVDGEEVVLTALEFRLLSTLLERRGRVQSRERLLAEKRNSCPENAEQKTVRRMVVRQILAAMPENMSEILILREMEEQNYVEIGLRLTLPVGTVKSRLSAARKRFRRDYLKAMQEEF
jgi:RNA polymerase sigma factor (sigma-70 family)